MLLILDGCEAVVDGVASLVTALLASCPLLSVVVTSRVPLAVEGERDRWLAAPPLPESAPSCWPTGCGRAAGGSRSPAPAAPFVAELCRRCGGLPLALELVAAQLAAMSVADLLDHLPEVAGEGGQLRAIAASSYDLLDADEALRLPPARRPRRPGRPAADAATWWRAARSRRSGWCASCAS